MTMADSIRNYFGEADIELTMPSFAAENSKNGRTCPLFYADSNLKFYIESSELEAQYPPIGISDVCKPVDAFCQLHYDISAPSDYPCCNIEEPVSQCLDESLFIHARQCQSLKPVDDIVCQHPDCQICPVCMKLLTRESIKGKSVFCLSDEIFHDSLRKMKRDKFFCRFSPVGYDYMIPIRCNIKKRCLFFYSAILPALLHNDTLYAIQWVYTTTQRPKLYLLFAPILLPQWHRLPS